MPVGVPDFGIMWEFAKSQTLQMGAINIAWDFTDGLTKQQWIEREERRLYGAAPKHKMAIDRKTGKIVMPYLGIY